MDAKDKSNQLKKLTSDVESIKFTQVEMNVLLKQNTKILAEHQKASQRNGDRLSILESWTQVHQAQHASRWGMVKDIGILVGIILPLTKLFGVI